MIDHVTGEASQSQPDDQAANLPKPVFDDIKMHQEKH